MHAFEKSFDFVDILCGVQIPDQLLPEHALTHIDSMGREEADTELMVDQGKLKSVSSRASCQCLVSHLYAVPRRKTVRVSQCRPDKTLAGKSVRRQTSGDNGVEYGKFRYQRGKMVRSR